MYQRADRWGLRSRCFLFWVTFLHATAASHSVCQLPLTLFQDSSARPHPGPQRPGQAALAQVSAFPKISDISAGLKPICQWGRSPSEGS